MMFKNTFRGIPLLGGLVDSSKGDHWEALQELFVVIVLSLIPIWLGALVVFILGSSSTWQDAWVAILNTLQGGELFIYAATLLAPVVWIALKDPPGANAFPSKISHILLVVIVNIIAACFFGIQKAGLAIDQDITFDGSILLFCFSVVLLYLAKVYHNARLPDPGSEFRDREEEFVTRHRRRRG